MAEPNFLNRTLYHLDNLDVLRGMNSESVHLIATDPPFNKNKDFHATPDSLARGARFQDRWRWIEDVHDDWLIQIMRDFPEVYAVISTTREGYGSDMAAFLAFMGIRLIEMQRILRPDGSIYLHCDHTASHYLKMLMDAIFGSENFRNEIVWQRAAGRAKGSQHKAKSLGTDTDSILWYSKNPTGFTFHGMYTPLSEKELKEQFPFTDERGRYNTNVPIFCQPSMGPRPNLCYEYNGIRNPHPSGWRVSRERLAEMDARGEIIWREGKRPLRKSYADAYKGRPLGDLWTDIPNLTGGKERTGYPTQKPLALYERIIKASSNPGDIVLDPFAGCATTPIAAERLRRQWVGIDIWDSAYQTVLHRLKAEGLAVKDAATAAESDQPNLITFGDVHYLTTPPTRTDYQDPMPYFQTPTAQNRRRYPPPRSQHANLIADIGAYCQGCGANYAFDTRVLEVDHKLPKSDGGSDAYDNLTLLCPPCNRLKSDRLTLTGLQIQNRQEGHLKPENEPHIRHGNPTRGRRRTTRRPRR